MADNNAKPNKGKPAPNVEYGAMRFRLPKNLERGVRYASFELEDNAKAVHKTPQSIVEEAVRRYLDLLGKHINFPAGVLPSTKPNPDKDAPASPSAT